MRSNANLFRAFAKIEDQMIRATMPRIDKIDPVQPQRPQLPAAVRVLRAPAALTYKLGEVVRNA